MIFERSPMISQIVSYETII